MASIYNAEIPLIGGLTTLPRHQRNRTHTTECLNCDISNKGLTRRNGAVLYKSVATVEDTISYAYNTGRENEAYLILVRNGATYPTYHTAIVEVYDSTGVKIDIDVQLLGNGATPSYLHYPRGKTIRESFHLKAVKGVVYLINRTIKVEMNYVNRTQFMLDSYFIIYAKYVSIEKNVSGNGYFYEIKRDGVSNRKQFEKRDELLQWAKDTINNGGMSICHFDEYALYGNFNPDIPLSVASDGQDEPFRLIRRKVKTFEDLPSNLNKDKFKWFYWEANDGEKYYIVFGWDDLVRNWETKEVTRQEPKLDTNGTKEVYGTYPTKKTKHGGIYPCAYMEIMEGKGDDYGGYFVEWNDGDWWETVEPDSLRRLDETTMPMKLYKKDTKFALSYDTFRFKNATVANPPFVGNYIQDVLFFKRRIGYVTSTAISFSAIIESDQLNFFADTARAIQPHHPLFYGIDSSKVAVVKQVETIKDGIYLIASDCIYNNIFSDKISTSPSVSKVSDMAISHAVIANNNIYFLNKGRLHVLADNKVTYIGQAFEGLIDDTIDMVVYQPRGYIFFLLADNKTIMTYRWLDLGAERVIGFLSKWTFENKIYSIEVADDKLILAKDVGIFAIDLVVRDTVIIDTDGSFESKYILSDNIISNKWYKYFMKRLEIFKSGRVITSLYRDNTLIEEIEEDEINIINGTNLDTSIEFKSHDTDPFEIEFVMMTLQVENGNLKRI